VIPGDGELCDNFDLTKLTPLVFGAKEGATRLVWPPRVEDVPELRAAWLEAVQSQAPVLVGARLILAADFLRAHDQGAPRLTNQTPFLLAEGNIGQGTEIGWPSAAGSALMIGRLPSLLASYSGTTQDLFRTGLATCVFLPIIGLGFMYWRRRTVWFWSVMGACVPTIWILNFATVSPWNDTRYIAPAAVWGIFFTFTLVIAAARDPEPTSESARITARQPVT